MVRPFQQKYYLLPFFNDSHASLIIYGSDHTKLIHVDSFLMDTSHIKILKGKRFD